MGNFGPKQESHIKAFHILCSRGEKKWKGIILPPENKNSTDGRKHLRGDKAKRTNNAQQELSKTFEREKSYNKTNFYQQGTRPRDPELHY